ncbi:hypothetical protein H0H87_007692 [Tephrocybe sp. NHM501043]|nr:hypothetical protein H0H87_007692 [Tephrocybe sp. NHM501043]
MSAFPNLRAKPFNERLAQVAKSYSVHRPLVQRFLNISFVIYALTTTYRGLASRPSSSSPKGRGKTKTDQGETGKPPRVAVDALFYQRLSSILRIVIPSMRSKEALLLVMHSSLLIFRTGISLYVAALDGKIVASLVRARPKEFFWNILRWLLVAVPATWTNSWLSYVQNKLAIAYRTRLTKEVMKQYLGEESEGHGGKVYYKISNLDDRIKNPDQMITHDIQRFSTHLAAIYSNMAKPVLDVILYNYQLSQNVGAEGLLILAILVQSSAIMLRRLTPPFGMYTVLSAQLSGSLRHTHSRIAEFAEEIAFLNGEQTEKTLLEREYASVLRHENHVLSRRWWFGCVEEGVIKWLWGAYGLVLCSIPVFFKIPGARLDLGGRTEDAFGRVMYSYKDLSELAGYTARVFLLLDTMKDVRKGKFDKALVTSATIGENANSALQHLLIVGPNGCGKSSLFRILGGLWPVYGGVVRKPPASEFILIPQRPYLSLGNLRDQVIYPHSKAQMEARGVTDKDLLNILAVVGMESVVSREGGWDITREWRDALSGGDKQKIAWASTKLDAEKRLALQEEKQCLENKLLEVPKMTARLTELKALAG